MISIGFTTYRRPRSLNIGSSLEAPAESTGLNLEAEYIDAAHNCI